MLSMSPIEDHQQPLWHVLYYQGMSNWLIGFILLPFWPDQACGVQMVYFAWIVPSYLMQKGYFSFQGSLQVQKMLGSLYLGVIFKWLWAMLVMVVCFYLLDIGMIGFMFGIWLFYGVSIFQIIRERSKLLYGTCQW
jgi:hypothetical protein